MAIALVSKERHNYATFTEYRVVLGTLADGDTFEITGLLKGIAPSSVLVNPKGSTITSAFVGSWAAFNTSTGTVTILIESDGGGALTSAQAEVIIRYDFCANQDGSSLDSGFTA